MFHRPGLPSDLPGPEDLWGRAGAVAVVSAGSGAVDAALVDRSLAVGVPGSGFRLLRVGDGRFVLLGQNPDSAPATGLRRPTDPFDGAPSWLPVDWLERHRLTDPHFLYWWEDTWVRAAYPDDWDDDGIAGLLGWSATPSATADEVARLLGPGSSAAEVDEFVARCMGRDLTREAVAEAASGVSGFDTGTAVTVAHGLGLTEGSDPPELPAGQGPPPVRSVPLIGRDEWALLVGDALRTAGEDHGYDPSGRADPALLEHGPPADGAPPWAGLLDPRTRWSPPWPGPPGLPSVDPVEMDAQERAVLIDRIRALVVEAADGLPWRKLRLVHRALVGYAGGEIVAVSPDAEHHVPLPDGLREEMALLRSATFSPGYGAWFTACLTLEHGSGWRMSYDRTDEPAFSIPPPAFSYALDARYFPRDGARTPLWLAERLRAAGGGS
ncbi:hypothetical protein IDM40_05135 [Nocardiopsis sp. HNM0947]|uniref:Uncharacterized protein n=1 Tax=Nocardiopsis coralli TaxID=2772213 RepID=A0ABR9P2S0_9ACTN|nr:hypothetical protein [Nocardiopsis coralli]MBE2998092.1 hypothetical protein [Nocardiopsis coralli]